MQVLSSWMQSLRERGDSTKLASWSAGREAGSKVSMNYNAVILIFERSQLEQEANEHDGMMWSKWVYLSLSSMRGATMQVAGRRGRIP